MGEASWRGWAGRMQEASHRLKLEDVTLAPRLEHTLLSRSTPSPCSTLDTHFRLRWSSSPGSFSLLPFAASKVTSQPGLPAWPPLLVPSLPPLPLLSLLPTAHCDGGLPSGHSASWHSSRPWAKPAAIVFSNVESKVPQLRPLFDPLKPRNIASTYVRCLVMAYIPVLEYYLPKEDLGDSDSGDEGDGTEAPPEPPPDLIQPAFTAGKSVIREVVVQILRRGIERLVVPWVSAHTGWALTHDTFKEAKDRARLERGTVGQRMLAVGDVFADTVTSHILGCVASLVLQLKIDIVQFFRYFHRKRRAIRHRPKLLYHKGSVLLRRITAHSVKTFGQLVGASLGAALLEVLWPGNGYSCGYALAETLSGSALNKFLDPILVAHQNELDELERQADKGADEEARKREEEERRKGAGEGREGGEES